MEDVPDEVSGVEVGFSFRHLGRHQGSLQRDAIVGEIFLKKCIIAGLFRRANECFLLVKVAFLVDHFKIIINQDRLT